MAFAPVQNKQNNGTAVTTLNVTLDAPATAGSLLVCFLRLSSSTGQTITVTDDKGNTYAASSGSLTTGAMRVQQFYGVQVVGGATIITFTWTASANIRASVDEYSGAATSNAMVFDTTANFSNAGSTTTATIPITPATVGKLVVANFGTVNAVTVPVAGTGYTLGSTGSTVITEYNLSAASPESAAVTWTGATQVRGIASSFNLPQPPNTTTGRNLLLGV